MKKKSKFEKNFRPSYGTEPRLSAKNTPERNRDASAASFSRGEKKYTSNMRWILSSLHTAVVCVCLCVHFVFECDDLMPVNSCERRFSPRGPMEHCKHPVILCSFPSMAFSFGMMKPILGTAWRGLFDNASAFSVFGCVQFFLINPLNFFQCRCELWTLNINPIGNIHVSGCKSWV